MKKEFLLALLLTIAYPAFSQEPPVTVTANYIDRGVSFDAESKRYGTTTIILRITELSGYRNACGSESAAIITHGSKQCICRLIKDESIAQPRFSYSYSYYWGAYDAKPQEDFPYLLPIQQGKTLKTSKLINLTHTIGKTVKDTILGVIFNFSQADTILAARSGTIVEIKERERDALNVKGELFYDAPSRCIIRVEHKDGTVASYSCIGAVSCLVKEGDRAIAGQPMAVFAEDETKRHLGFSIYYLRLTQEKKSDYRYTKPKFLLQDGLKNLGFGEGYTSVSSKEVIEKELTNKERKKMK